MLVLSRSIGQTLVIDGDIKVTILGIKENQIRVGIEAPLEVSVDREEVHYRKLRSYAESC